MEQIVYRDCNLKYHPKHHNMACWKSYKVYKKRMRNPLSYHQWMKVLDDFHHEIEKEAAINRHGVALPERLGTVFMAGCEPTRKPERKALDLTLSRQTGFRVERGNLHTGGYQCKIFFTHERGIHSDHEIWAFKPCVRFKKIASKAFRADWQRYQLIHWKTTVMNLYKKQRRKRMAVQELAGYDPLS